MVLSLRRAVPDRGLGLAAAALLVLNLLDGVLTLIVVQAGVASEANPFMDVPLARGAVPFMLVKLALVSLGVLLLWRLRGRRLASAALVASVAVYALVLVYHLPSMNVLARSVAQVTSAG